MQSAAGNKTAVISTSALEVIGDLVSEVSVTSL